MNGPAPVCWAVIPVKAPGVGKTRLAGVLDDRQRQALVTSMLERVISAAEACAAVERVFLVGPSDFGLTATRIDDRGGDLNEALASAMQQLRRGPAWSQARLRTGSDSGEPVGDSAHDGATGTGSTSGRREAAPQRVIILAGDLPQVDARDFAMLADVSNDGIGIAPDRHGTGTNALSLPWSCLADFIFRFGIGSFAAHRLEAYRLGYKLEVQLSPGLEKDIDEPADLADARHCLQEA